MLPEYWTIVLEAKTPYERSSERFVFFWPLTSETRSAPAVSVLRFHRVYLFVAVFLIQFCSGSVYSLLSLADPINRFFGFGDNSPEATNLLFEAGVFSLLSPALLGPLLERKGPRCSMAAGTLLTALGLLLSHAALLTSSWTLLHVGFDCIGFAFGAIVTSSISTALKWAPDVRGTVTGACLLGSGVGTNVWRIAFEAILASSFDNLRSLFGLLFAVLVPILMLATLVLRTPPSDFSVRGHDMHCIPLEKAPNADMVLDEYFKVGMTLLNYNAIRPPSDCHHDGTDRQYYEQVKALTLPQCILSTDFLCLFVAFAANGLSGLLYTEVTAVQVEKDLLVTWYAITDDDATRVRLRGAVADLVGRFLISALSDVCIRLFYGNPAVVRKSGFVLLLLVQCIAVPMLYFASDNMSNFGTVEWLLYTVQFTANAGASLIVCFLTDMYGVYHVGTMYGLVLMGWAVDQVVLGRAPLASPTDLAHHVELVWFISLGGLFLMWFVRTTSADRFYRGYQLTICGKVLIQRPAKSRFGAEKTHGCDADAGHPGSFFLLNSDSMRKLEVNDVLSPTTP
ncbi:hypothetical protein SDRG_06446 [Saprolegnia diclina VS20]|uniref:Major facilitator superfamily (MFS) profile domain-containing protein n=1 Tax=Saprolegnia diclina (strain VS20) TaxID=1156394 RepID=T0QNP1_SAPDV|nr:hypothetical protein SDRG_06446 [Saprolegnia diclina VS20]EQC36341.1 hypothetical protein SDRG_06446 [Saprolegnia diclina VS20]|eukprot:XP_008610447.1 hypothetical protein SDRG_06446 [Saprolegnia diclina VS20]